MTKLTGLLVGAGASYEVGLPLARRITDEFRSVFVLERLREFNRSWRAHGAGYPDHVVEDLGRVLARPDMHYESVLGYLETQFRRPGSPVELRRAYHGLYSWLVEAVYQLLYHRHIANAAYIKHNLRYLDGIASLAAQNAPLWIFSLNHDVVVECLAARHNIPVSFGFVESTTVPRRGKDGRKTGELRAEIITAESLEHRGMPFLQPGTSGINLLKVHGGLDVFAFRDGKDLLRVLPTGPGMEGVLDALRAANEELVFLDPAVPESAPFRVVNEIAYADDSGECQFLRRSLLAGSFKFDDRGSQVLPMRLLSYFRSHLNCVSSLVCIGYGFGDQHVNDALRGWLEFSAERRLEIVRPDATSIPPALLHLAPQVTLTGSGAADYLDTVAGISRTREERLEKRLVDWVRDRGARGRSELIEFIERQTDARRKALVEKLAALPFRDGDVDLDALGVTKEEFIARWVKEVSPSVEDALEAFLASRDRP